MSGWLLRSPLAERERDRGGGKVVDVRGGQGARPRVDTGTKECQDGQKESENELHVGSVVSQRLEKIRHESTRLVRLVRFMRFCARGLLGWTKSHSLCVFSA